MKILITIPSFGHHGGLNVIVQWANRLTKWHEVYLYNQSGKANATWQQVSPKVKLADFSNLWSMDALIVTSPHGVDLLDMVRADQKCFVFVQMLEHLFRPPDLGWARMCARFYKASCPMICISEWNRQELRKFRGRDPELIIGNGIDLAQFPITKLSKGEGKTVLLENPESDNLSKDVLQVAGKVAERLRREGYRIIGYGARPLLRLKKIPHEYFVKPPLLKLNQLYEQATIFLKATWCDARSTAPIEAMTKGTVTARAITEGDDDLVHDYNCLRSTYNEFRLYDIAKQLLTDEEKRKRLAANGYNHLREHCNWDVIMEKVNEFIEQ